jgi:hypothetical protein
MRNHVTDNTKMKPRAVDGSGILRSDMTIGIEIATADAEIDRRMPNVSARRPALLAACIIEDSEFEAGR